MMTDDALADLPPTQSARLRLAPLLPADADALAELTDDPAITGVIPFLASPFTVADAEALIDLCDGGEDCFIGAWRLDDDRLVGVVGAHLRGDDALEIGYWFGPAFHGMGYASEAVLAVVSLLRDMPSHREIIAECRPENAASWRVLEKSGFRATGEPGTRPGRKLLRLDVSVGH
jgi:RimJ/RimL family protein N-acetyltransferase